MELEFSKGRIIFEKELSFLDKLVFEFTAILDKQKINYVVVSGYIAILFGRSRNTEDIDLFIEEMPLKKFLEFWNELYAQGFECLNTSNPEEAFNDYLKEKLAVRFALKGSFEPNFEVKFPKTDLNWYSLKNKLVVEINKEKLNISKIELQIPFKLYLGSDKDIEDAIHLWEIFKDRLNIELFNGFIERLKVGKKINLLEGKT